MASSEIRCTYPTVNLCKYVLLLFPIAVSADRHDLSLIFMIMMGSQVCTRHALSSATGDPTVLRSRRAKILEKRSWRLVDVRRTFSKSFTLPTSLFVYVRNGRSSTIARGGTRALPLRCLYRTFYYRTQ